MIYKSIFSILCNSFDKKRELQRYYLWGRVYKDKFHNKTFLNTGRMISRLFLKFLALFNIRRAEGKR
ncbi:hypothetical protein JXA56_03960, partial [Candidatus Micrarchaeota archaeon]|nr:hypothetical protein [Candidatus Micrarchaeota archaeon]